MKRKIGLTITLISLITLGYFAFGVVRFRQVRAAAGKYPYQPGIMNAVVNQCLWPTAPCPVNCCYTTDGIGTAACVTKTTVAQCAMYSYINGQFVGQEKVNGPLLLNTTIAAIGLSPGGQYIGGGMMNTQMDSGVSGSVGGVMGVAVNLTDRIEAKVKSIAAAIKAF